jgi:hypothetical protein
VGTISAAILKKAPMATGQHSQAIGDQPRGIGAADDYEKQW